jgi:Skp family chaperone for outer membrane proteins
METTIPKEHHTPNGKPMYTLVPDGNNQWYKVVNFDNEEMVQSKGIKIIRALKKSSRHQPAVVTRLERDPITGIIFGIPAGISETTKNLRFQPIELNDQVQYDLSVREDRMRWAVISRAKFLQGSPFQKGKPTHVLYDVDAEAIKKVETVNERKLAYATMDGLSSLQIVDMARNCGGINVINNSEAVIKGELYDFIDSKEANKGAAKFNAIWKMGNREAMTVFNRCKAVGLVSFDINNGWLWKLQTSMGTTEPTAIDYMTKNPALLMAMDNESRSMDAEFDKNATTEEREKVITAMPVANKGVDDNILKEMDKRMKAMDEKEAKLEALLAKLQPKDNIDLEAKVEIPVMKSPAENSVAENEGLAELRKRAKTLGMPHAMLPKITEATILKWIEENSVKA